MVLVGGQQIINVEPDAEIYQILLFGAVKIVKKVLSMDPVSTLIKFLDDNVGPGHYAKIFMNKRTDFRRNHDGIDEFVVRAKTDGAGQVQKALNDAVIIYQLIDCEIPIIHENVSKEMEVDNLVLELMKEYGKDSKNEE